MLAEIGGCNESGPIHQMLDGKEGEGEGEGEGVGVERGKCSEKRLQEQVPKKLQGGMPRFLVNWRADRSAGRTSSCR